MAGEGSAFTVLLGALEGLTLEGFQEFKTKLSHVHTKGGWNIPEDVLVEATHPSTLVNCMGNSYGEDAAVDIAIGLFEEMKQRDLAEKILDEKVKEYKQKYREHVAREFLRYKELNSCLGENLSVSSRYTALTIAKKPWSQRGGEPEGADVSWGCADTTTAVTAQTLFKPDEDGQTPQTVVLVGAPGMGKTMMVRKMMVEWVEGALYMQFDYVFCIDCKELSLSKQVSVLDLVSKCCPHQRIPAGSILDNQEKVLFIFDGFEALGFPLAQPKDELSSDPREAKPLEITLMSLLKRTVLPASSLLITTRPTALQNLGRCLEGECYVEILGFSAAAREEYFHRYFKNDNKADVAFRFTRGNETLYSLCIIPIMSWTICTILEQELYKKNNLLECSKATTWMGMFYLSWLMNCRGSNAQQYLQQFLRKLCSLAADGIWKHKVLFEEREIKDCGLDWPDLLSLFLNEKSLKKGVDQGNVYSFTHLHLHEFFAAMFYVLDDDEETVSDPEAPAKNVNTLLESYSKSRKDLNLTIRFLFGLVNPKSIEYAGERIGCRISPRAREDLLRWLQTRHRGLSHRSEAMMIKELDTFHFLYEMSEKSFVQNVLGCFTGIDLHDIKLTPYDQMALCFCIKQWDGLDSVTLRSCSFHQQQCREEPATVLPWQHPLQEELCSPLHPLCHALGHADSSLQNLRLQWCGLTEGGCKALGMLLATHPSLVCLELGDGALGDSGVQLLCTGLRQPGCQLRILRLRYTRMTSACCQDLAAVLGTSPHLEELDLSFNTGLRDAGVQLLCEGLRDHACQLRVLRLGSCHLTGTCCQALATHLGESCSLSCLDLSDTELGAGAVLLLRQLGHPACPLQALGLSVSALNEDALQELVALRKLKPSLKIGDLLEHDTPQEGAMSRLPFQRGVWEGKGRLGGRKALLSSRVAPPSSRNLC
ncbi:NACHT, LRR and PYD domains-containing protein 12-like [Cygnus atratus]|uniref:NACHT, LRR and PYD domains-containing protein 12-like n=1 Tax=Cygnus atratus TaxID=8868 RepID=UPI0015D5A804|nr:NACHT, LRR and PYD domains-containing protein 12-like [Cygnus atratus]XP_035395703.1 NACHT, LRR and PYD domains-containing protein 12-like [Cygnus atratus]XP_050567244.1 NACHT, LRR and PYD domains-containing protein 12-like [Cygnus atratus]XP_050567245.1 NACHT, LRR and PYD domains-containing protein 12-like [Cygnus atratus]